ncbi:CHAP domain-containing protein [Spirillospora sp. NBC_00431]
MSAAGMLAEAVKSLGMTGRPNKITKEYASRHGDEFLRASWCDMAITYWARHSGNASAVLPGGDRAYTVWHATDFKQAGRWYEGTAASVNRCKPGDIVFFDWGATNAIGAIDHVGVVEKVLGGGRVQTIEANTGDAVKRRVRAASMIAGYGRPAYEEDDVSAKDVWDEPIDTGDGKATWKARTVLGHLEKEQDAIKAMVAQIAAKVGAPLDVDEDAIVRGVLAGLTPERIAAAIPANIGEQVAAALAARLAGRKE